jgi:hypothetical protein
MRAVKPRQNAVVAADIPTPKPAEHHEGHSFQASKNHRSCKRSVDLNAPLYARSHKDKDTTASAHKPAHSYVQLRIIAVGLAVGRDESCDPFGGVFGGIGNQKETCLFFAHVKTDRLSHFISKIP